MSGVVLMPSGVSNHHMVRNAAAADKRHMASMGDAEPQGPLKRTSSKQQQQQQSNGAPDVPNQDSLLHKQPQHLPQQKQQQQKQPGLQPKQEPAAAAAANAATAGTTPAAAVVASKGTASVLDRWLAETQPMVQVGPSLIGGLIVSLTLVKCQVSSVKDTIKCVIKCFRQVSSVMSNPCTVSSAITTQSHSSTGTRPRDTFDFALLCFVLYVLGLYGYSLGAAAATLHCMQCIHTDHTHWHVLQCLSCFLRPMTTAVCVSSPFSTVSGIE